MPPKQSVAEKKLVAPSRISPLAPPLGHNMGTVSDWQDRFGRIHDMFASAMNPIIGQTRNTTGVLPVITDEPTADLKARLAELDPSSPEAGAAGAQLSLRTRLKKLGVETNAQLQDTIVAQLRQVLVGGRILSENAYHVAFDGSSVSLLYTPTELYNRAGMQALLEDKEITAETKEILCALLGGKERVLSPIDFNQPHIKPEEGIPHLADERTPSPPSKGFAYRMSKPEEALQVAIEKQKEALQAAIEKHGVFRGKDVFQIEAQEESVSIGFSIHEKTHYNAHLNKKNWETLRQREQPQLRKERQEALDTLTPEQRSDHKKLFTDIVEKGRAKAVEAPSETHAEAAGNSKASERPASR